MDQRVTSAIAFFFGEKENFEKEWMNRITVIACFCIVRVSLVFLILISTLAMNARDEFSFYSLIYVTYV